MAAASKGSTKVEVPCTRNPQGDWYIGTRKELIAAGVCKPEWFPGKLEREFCKDGRPKIGNNGRQRTRRTYRVQGRTPETTLQHRVDVDGRECWIVRVTISREQKRERQWQQERREQERERQWQQQNMPPATPSPRATDAAERRVQEEHEKRLNAALANLPPFSSGSMSDSEQHHMRILRALNDEGRDMVLGFAEVALLHQPCALAAPPPPRLRLVVDNEARP